MRAYVQTRTILALLGAGLAVVGCLIAPTSRPASPPHRPFVLPKALGSWELLEQLDLHESEVVALQASNHCRYIYRCRKSGQIVVVTLVAGAAGPLASHQPELCYARREFASHGESRTWTIPQRCDTFRFQSLEPRQVDRPALTVAYAWHDGQRWRAPRAARLQLAGHATLQRLQFAIRHPSCMARDARTTLERFIELTLSAAVPEPSRFARLTGPTQTLLTRAPEHSPRRSVP